MKHKQKIKHPYLFIFSIYLMLCGPLLAFSGIFKDSTPEKIILTRLKAQIIAASLNKYILDTGLIFPEDDFYLASLLTYPNKDKNLINQIKHPDLDADPLNDAWGNPFTIQFDSRDKFRFDIISWGADGIPSTGKADPDIVYSDELISRKLQQIKDMTQTIKKRNQTLPELGEQ